MTSIELMEATQSSVREKVYDRLRLARRYVASLYKSRQERTWFQDVRTYCMFIGHARSGHSIFGALLDAHPNAILADEVDALQYVEAGFSRDQIFHLLLARSQRQAKRGRTKGGRDGKVYSYQVPGQWQGRFSTLRVIGDSTAGKSTQRLAQHPELLWRLQDMLKDVHVKFIHVIRNPYDTISTMNLRSGRPLTDGIQRYFSNCATIATMEKRLEAANLFAVRQEDFIEQPAAHLEKMCRFLDIEPDEEYIRACTSILYRSPATSRHKVQWSPELIDVVRRRMDDFETLKGYAYE